MKRHTRREFLHAGVFAAVSLGLGQTGCTGTSGNAARSPRVAFNTANLVARFTNYRFELARWGEQHQKTVAPRKRMPRFVRLSSAPRRH